MVQVSDQSYYEILEVPEDASRDDITRAYHRAKNAYSTNSAALYSVFSKDEATEILKMIDEAYSVLINQERRRDYDKALGSKQPPKIGELPDFAPPTELRKPGSQSELSPYGKSASAVTTSNVSSFAGTRAETSSRTSSAPVSASSSANGVKEKSPRFVRDDAFEKEIEAATQFDGAFLAKIREYKKVTVEEISEQTRIGRHYLVALEQNKASALPAPVFVRGFVVQYAKSLGLNEKAVADSYMKLLKDLRDQ